MVIFVLPLAMLAQGFYNANAWRRFRHEIRIEFGASNFLGEVGGRDRLGSNFIWDLELSQTKFSASFNHLYYLSEKVGLRTSINYGKVSGDDALTTESYRNNRNLHFQSIIVESGMSVEWHFLKDKPGNIYNVRSVTGKKLGKKGINSGFYVTGGIHAFYFNPQALAPSGQWVDLKPLSTEGQGFPDGAKEYNRVSVAVPIGGGWRKNISRTVGLKLELTHRFTFTDYIDDISTVYYDPNILSAEISQTAAYLSNPHLGNKRPIVTEPGQQRGDSSDNDGYMFLTAGVYFKLQNKGNVYGRNKVKRVKASF